MLSEHGFNIKMDYPLDLKEYDKRAAKAVARYLISTLPPKKIDELIAAYKKSTKSKK